MGKRIGIVGSGFIARKHLEAFEHLDGAEIIGMCTYSNYDGLKQLCMEHGINSYRSLEELLKLGKPDAVILCSVTSAHYGEILQAAEAGVSLLVEKPVVGFPEQYAQIRKAAEKNKILLFPAHNFIYRKSVHMLKQQLEEGTIGKVLHASFFSTQLVDDSGDKNWRCKKALSCGGALLDSGHHLVYQMLYLFGIPQRMQAFTAKLRLDRMECEDMAQIHMQMPDGALCVVMQSWASEHKGPADGISILGTEGELHLTDALYLNGEKIGELESYEESFCLQAEAFLDCLNGIGRPLSNLDDSEHTVQLIHAAYRSDAEGSVYRTK